MELITWTEIHDRLQVVMKRELETIRQLLANMNLEEQFILKKEEQYKKAMMEERASLIKQLEDLRKDKQKAMEKLEAIAQLSNPQLEQLLPPQDFNSWEVLSLRDQIIILLDRINLQSSRNEMLVYLVREPDMTHLAPQKKSKISLETLPCEDYKEMPND